MTQQPVALGTLKSWQRPFIEWIEEWSQLLGGCNWYTFHPIMIELEDDRMMGAVEGTFIVLGLGFRFRWNFRVTERSKELLSAVEEINSEVNK